MTEHVNQSEAVNVSQMRISYERAELLEQDLASSPLEQFNLWLQDAVALGKEVIPEPNAMVLSTSNQYNELHSRSVLLKGIDERGLMFYSNYNSTKAQDITSNENVSALFPWYPLHRQVIVNGSVSKLSKEESEAYFATRPYKSQLGALASNQSEVIASRAIIEQKMADLEMEFPEGSQVPMPSHWGGYLITVQSMEFWQGRRSRLHDRLRFIAVVEQPTLNEPTHWKVARLSP